MKSIPEIWKLRQTKKSILEKYFAYINHTFCIFWDRRSRVICFIFCGRRRYFRRTSENWWKLFFSSRLLVCDSARSKIRKVGGKIFRIRKKLIRYFLYLFSQSGGNKNSRKACRIDYYSSLPVVPRGRGRSLGGLENLIRKCAPLEKVQ